MIKDCFCKKSRYFILFIIINKIIPPVNRYHSMALPQFPYMVCTEEGILNGTLMLQTFVTHILRTHILVTHALHIYSSRTHLPQKLFSFLSLSIYPSINLSYWYRIHFKKVKKIQMLSKYTTNCKCFICLL